MAKRKQKAKRSLGALPKGLPGRKRGLPADVNPFETLSRQKRPKHEVHNRNTAKLAPRQSALAKSLQRRQTQLKETLNRSKKSNLFVDRRIGEYSSSMTSEEQMLARLVRERSRRSKRVSKYSLDDGADEAPTLTHKGRAIDDFTVKDHVMLSDDEDENGNLEAVDTELHFGGGSFSKASDNAYGVSSENMADVYSHRKTELDDLIARRKILKAERIKSREDQVETFETMDDSFKDLASMLQFRDKAQERREREEAKRQGVALTQEDQEMAEWDMEMKEYLFERRVKATDRTKTPEEIANEKAQRLHQLETRRLARMNGDFEDDDFEDLSDDEAESGRHAGTRRKKGQSKHRNPEELEDSDVEGEESPPKVLFTADGLVYVDKEGNVQQKVGNESEDFSKKDDSEDVCSRSDSGSSSDDSDRSDDDSQSATDVILSVGDHVQGNYRIKEQFEGRDAWCDGVISGVHRTPGGNVTYNIEYTDGDVEEDMEPRNVRLIEKTDEERQKETSKKSEVILLKRKRQQAKNKARQDIPFVFEAPTTLEALHDMIGRYASTGEDASLILERIHVSNSVRLNKNNKEKMQNFYDVLLRRFMAVGDAISSSGDGGLELGRSKQLDALTKTLYRMSQDSPNCAGAVWGRRLGILQRAHAKRLRDTELVAEDEDEEETTAWPSTGTILLLRAMGHIFPVTDKRHVVVSPALLLLGQIISQTPVKSLCDLTSGVMCSGIMIEFTLSAKRLAPEAHSFLADVLRLFSTDTSSSGKHYAVPTLEAASQSMTSLRVEVSMLSRNVEVPRLSLEKNAMEADTAAASVLCAALRLVEKSAQSLGGSIQDGEAEAFAGITESLLCLAPTSMKNALPVAVAQNIATAAAAVTEACRLDQPRKPLKRRLGPSVSEMAIKTLAPRMENPSRYSMSKDKGKTSIQAATDRARREYKREHKAVARELRLDAAFIENERRTEKDNKDRKAREKRHKNFAWLEGEQAVMNQQVAQGGGLLSGGGMGAARNKARSGKVGIKKGGKF